MKRKYHHPEVTIIHMGIASMVCNSVASLSTEKQDNGKALSRKYRYDLTDFDE